MLDGTTECIQAADVVALASKAKTLADALCHEASHATAASEKVDAILIHIQENWRGRQNSASFTDCNSVPSDG